MIAVECEFPVEKVMSPVFEGLDDGIQFPIIVGIANFGVTELLA